jgi:glutamate synthase domain-containing protein 3
MGKVAIGLLESGGQLGVSTRGMGSLKESNGVMIVQRDFSFQQLILYQIQVVLICFVNGIMEGVEYFYDPVKNTWMEEKLDNTKKKIKKLSRSQIEEQKMAILRNYISSLVKFK